MKFILRALFLVVTELGVLLCFHPLQNLFVQFVT